MLLYSTLVLLLHCSAAPPEKSQSNPPPIRHSIQPNWLDSTRFWYSAQNEDGAKKYHLIDAIGRSRISADSYEELKTIAKGTLASDTKRRILPSDSEGNMAAQVTFINRAATDIRLFWFDSTRRSRMYHALAPNAQIEQHTYTGHVWFALDPSDKPIWTERISESAQQLTIEKQEIEEPFPSIARRRNQPSNPRTERPWRINHSDFNLEFQPLDPALPTFSTKNLPEILGTETNSYNGETVWSPDNRFVIAKQILWGEHREVTLIESSPKDQLQPKVTKVRYDKPGDRLDKTSLRLFETSTGRWVPIEDALFSNPWSIEEIRWAQDGNSFTFLYNQRGHQALRLIRVDASSGQATTLIEEKNATYIDYAHKAYRNYLDDSNEVLWGSERDGWYHLYLFDATTGKLRNQVTRGQWVVRSIERIDSEKRQIWFYAGGIAKDQDPYFRHLCRVNFDGTNLIQLTRGDGDHNCEFSPDRSYFIDKYSRVDLPPIFELRDSSSGELVIDLERSDLPALIASGWRSPERFAAKGRDGITDIYGIIVRPTDFDPARKYPLIEAIYAGPQDSFVPKAFALQSELSQLADKGFIVVKIDGMGTSNRSKAFHDVSYKNLADGGFPDRKLWISEAAKIHPEMDTSRVGIYGGSAGGQNAVAAVLFHGDFYHAAVADCGCHDNRMDKVWWNELYMGWPIANHYAENSNVTNAHRLTGKLFLMVGELDSNVDPASTMQVVNALIKADKTFDLLVTPGGGHGSGSSPYGKRRRDEFFLQHLGQPK